jgi:chloramphenicol-sensitive protein RarD
MNRGYLYAALSYVMWGLLPIYWKIFNQVDAWEILTHRIIWSVVFVLILVGIQRKWKKLREAIPDAKSFLALTLTSLLISLNWVTYIWSVNSNHMVETSLGYYITPLVNVFLGVFFLGERLSKLQWTSIALAAIGVIIMTVSYGQFPWVALALAVTFGLYGLAKKKIKVEPLIGLSLETMIVAPIALIFLLAVLHGGEALVVLPNWKIAVLLLAGVATASPLLFFAEGAKRLPLSVMGFFQYIAPTITLILSLAVYGETFTTNDFISFGFIWIALILYSYQIIKKQKEPRPYTT